MSGLTAKEIMIKLQGWLDFNDTVPEHLRLAQGKQELEKFCSILQTLDSRNICLEVGVFYGGTFYVWKQLFEHVVGIDVNQEYCDLVAAQLEQYGYDIATSHFICGSSQATETLAKTKEYLNGKQIDLLFIDGAHGYEALKMDFEYYLPLVRIGGIVAMHDVGDENAPHMPGGKPTPAGLTPTFENLHRCAMDINNDSERYGISKLSFIHIDHGGIGWCTKIKQADNYG